MAVAVTTAILAVLAVPAVLCMAVVPLAVLIVTVAAALPVSGRRPQAAAIGHANGRHSQ